MKPAKPEVSAADKPDGKKFRLTDFIIAVNMRGEYLEALENARQRSYGYRYTPNDDEAELFRALGRFLLVIESRYSEVKRVLSRKPRI